MKESNMKSKVRSLTATVKGILHKNDLFGYQVALNFNRNGSVHATSIGGFFSIIIKVLYVSYMILLLLKMVEYDDYRTFSESMPMDKELEDAFHYQDMDMQVYQSILHID